MKSKTKAEKKLIVAVFSPELNDDFLVFMEIILKSSSNFILNFILSSPDQCGTESCQTGLQRQEVHLKAAIFQTTLV